MALTDNLVSYWKLDESSGNAADSVASNTLTNGSVTYSAGKINNGAVFSAASSPFLEITDASQSGLDFTGNMSWSMWVKFTSLPADGDTMHLFSKVKTSGQFAYNGWVLNSGGTYSISFRCSSDGTTLVSKSVTWTPSTGVFYHLVFAYAAAAGSIAFYLNGSQQGTTQTGLPTSIKNGTDPLNLGDDGRHLGSTVALNGVLDEVGCWSRTLSSTDVTALYNGGAGLQYPFSTPSSVVSSVNHWLLMGV